MMRWSAGRGVHPLAASLSGCALIASCLISPAALAQGQLLLFVDVCAAVVINRPAVKVLLGLGLFALVIYMPMRLLLPTHAVLQGATITMVAALTLGLMGYPALHEAVLGLPMPHVLKLLLLQILHQASVLLRETSKIRQAMVVRGAVPRGRSGWQLLRALPRVWIPRVIFKADRVAHALELRGYGTWRPQPERHAWAALDRVYVLAGVLLCIAAIVLRLTV